MIKNHSIQIARSGTHIKHVADTDAQIKEWGARISILYGTHCSSVEYESARAAGRIHIGKFESEDSLSLRLEQSIVEPDSIFLVLSNQTYSIQFELLKFWEVLLVPSV